MQNTANALYLADGSTVSYGASIIFKKDRVTKVLDRQGNLTIIQEEGIPIHIPLSQAKSRATSFRGLTSYQFPDGTIAELDNDMNCESVSFAVASTSASTLFSSAQNWQTINTNCPN